MLPEAHHPVFNHRPHNVGNAPCGSVFAGGARYFKHFFELVLSLEAGLALERELQAKLFASEDAKEGLAAYNQKRKAEFKGR